MFGRIDLCDFVLEHPTISRFHAGILSFSLVHFTLDVVFHLFNYPSLFLLSFEMIFHLTICWHPTSEQCDLLLHFQYLKQSRARHQAFNFSFFCLL